MRLIVVVIAAVVACTSAQVPVLYPRGYHDEVGIPLAKKIKETEEKYMSAPQAEDNERIIGGVLAPANAHPYFAGLLIDMTNRPGQSVCGSSLLSPNRLLTAAHCWFDGFNQAWRFTVILGTEQLYFGGQRIFTTNVIMHPQWTPSVLMNDVAMIYLPINVAYSVRIQPIALPDFSHQTNSFVSHWATAVGFGTTSDSIASASSVLSHVSLQVITEMECRSAFGSSFVFPSTLCTSGAGRVGVCGGDSGGPLALSFGGRPILIGVSSFAADKACEQGWPSGFARVTSFLNFIQQHMW